MNETIELKHSGHTLHNPPWDHTRPGQGALSSHAQESEASA